MWTRKQWNIFCVFMHDWFLVKYWWWVNYAGESTHPTFPYIHTSNTVEENTPIRKKCTKDYSAPMGVRRNFSSGGAKSTFCFFFVVVDDATQIYVYKKDNVQCYSNSCIQCFPCKKSLHQAIVCFGEHGYFKTDLPEF